MVTTSCYCTSSTSDSFVKGMLEL